MSEEFLEKVFHPFEQEAPGDARNYVGSGLGLSIVYNLVQLMGGSVSVKSKKQEGSVFQVIIPFQLVTDALMTGQKWTACLKMQQRMRTSGSLTHLCP